MPAFKVLLDAPTDPRGRIQIAKLGRGYKDSRYGTFDITSREVQSWARNLAKLPGGRACIDLDHAADRPGTARNTEAAGWITAITLEAGVPTATVEWTPVGESAIRDKRYLFFSPTYGTFTDETGAAHPDTLVGGALTNKPFLNMATVCLAAEPVFVTQELADSRPAMTSTLAPIAKALGLSEDADQAAILAAIRKAKTAPPVPKTSLDALGLDETADEAAVDSAITTLAQTATQPPPRTLEVQASEAGKVLLSAEEWAKTRADAAQGKLAHKALADQAFDSAYTAALSELRVDAKDDTRTEWRELYDLAPEQTIKRLAALPAVASSRPRGEGGSTNDATPDGYDAEMHALDQRVQARIREKGEAYTVALAAVIADDERKEL